MLEVTFEGLECIFRGDFVCVGERFPTMPMMGLLAFLVIGFGYALGDYFTTKKALPEKEKLEAEKDLLEHKLRIK